MLVVRKLPAKVGTLLGSTSLEALLTAIINEVFGPFSGLPSWLVATVGTGARIWPEPSSDGEAKTRGVPLLVMGI